MLTTSHTMPCRLKMFDDEYGAGAEMDDALAGATAQVVPDDGPDAALLSHQIAAQLRTLIASDELKPGQRLRERALADRLNVSRTPLREALKELAGDGLVTMSPKRGAVVTELSAQQIGEKLDVLGAIEAFAGAQACRMASAAEIAEIRALHHEMLAAYERRDRANYFRLNQDIHLHLIAAAHNDTLRQVHEQINRQLFHYRYQSSSDVSTWHTAIAEHEVILALLNARDAEALGAYLQRHVHSTWEQLGAHGGNAGAS